MVTRANKKANDLYATSMSPDPGNYSHENNYEKNYY